MANAKVVLNHTAIGRLLKSPAVESALHDIADQVKANAESQNVMVNHGQDPMPYQVLSVPSATRARVYVVAAHPAGLAAEAKYGTLVKALDG